LFYSGFSKGKRYNPTFESLFDSLIYNNVSHLSFSSCVLAKFSRRQVTNNMIISWLQLPFFPLSNHLNQLNRQSTFELFILDRPNLVVCIYEYKC
jgi:hypothetical protein